jgi:ABC-type dipeptide/oligopeptide/nickel transport system ATPase subunit
VTAHRLSAEHITVTFRARPVLHDVDLAVHAGEIAGVTGPSGCGKTTLLRVLAGLHTPDRGSVTYGGRARPGPADIGMLAQHPRLVCNPRWPLRAIVSEPARIRGAAVDLAEVTESVGLDAALLERYPAQVSDGQLQRACIARALLQRPRFLLCDEPTAMLDPIATADIVDLLRQIAAKTTGIVLVSHDPRVIATLADSVLSLATTPSPQAGPRNR